MTTLYLVRHGETYDNARQVMQGQVQGELNATGVAQARDVRDRLAAERFDAVVASDLKRAVDTATIIAEPHGLPVVTTPLLRERDWGDFTGRYIPDLKGEPWPANVEPIDRLLARAADFLAWLKAGYPDKRVLAIGHGIVNKAVQAVHYGKQMSEVERMTNCEVRLLEL